MSLAAKHRSAGGLDLAGLGDLAAMLDGPSIEAGEPKLYDLAVIHEDKGNRRWEDNPGFSKESIAELAASFARREAQGKRGMKSPISLRPHPTIPGHFIINHGHRRFRAAKVAGMGQVPAFEDPDFDDVDQVVENIQRESHTAREIADFIAHKVAHGMSQAELARALGKSKAWVSQHAAMHALPDPIAEAVNSGQVTDVTVANELAAAHRENPAAVAAVLANGAKLTRSQVKTLRQPAKTQDPPASKPTVKAGDAAAPQLSRPERSAEMDAAFAKMRDERERERAERPAILAEGEAALKRLLPIAQRDTGQSGVVARFLLNLYNGNRFPFDNTDLRRLDASIVLDCLAVLRMDSRPQQEVHLYFPGGSKVWEQLAKDWGFRDFYGQDSWRSATPGV